MDFQDEIHRYNIALSRIDGFYQKYEQFAEMNILRCRILYALDIVGLQTQKQICDMLELPKQTVNNIISALVKQGYIHIIPDEADHRARILRLTESGKKYAETELQPLNELDVSIARRMGEEKYKLLVSLNEEYAEIIEQEITNQIMSKHKE